jgi:hypothetical protein
VAGLRLAPAGGVVTILDWRDNSHWSPRDARCRLCNRMTPLRDDAGRPCHKVCAEREIDRKAGLA